MSVLRAIFISGDYEHRQSFTELSFSSLLANSGKVGIYLKLSSIWIYKIWSMNSHTV